MARGTELEVEILTPLEFKNGEGYIVGHDTMGDGVVFDSLTYVCFTEEDLLSEIHRHIDDYDLKPTEQIPLSELIVIAKVLDIKLKFKKYQITKHKKLLSEGT